jgi:hypothetical protein
MADVKTAAASSVAVSLSVPQIEERIGEVTRDPRCNGLTRENGGVSVIAGQSES